MTYQEFFNTYNNKTGVGNTPENKGQCVGLISVWMDNLGIAHEWGNAKDLLANADTGKFDVILNSPTNFPVQGDIFVYDGTWGNGYGHTGIVDSANVDTFVGFEQNNPAGSACHLVIHPNYNHVLGWLHPKTQTDPLAVCLAQHTDLVNQCNQKDQLINNLNSQVAQLQATVSTQEHQLQAKDQSIETLSQQAKLADQIPNLNSRITDLMKSREGYIEQIAALQTQLNSEKNQSIPTGKLSARLYQLSMQLFINFSL